MTTQDWEKEFDELLPELKDGSMSDYTGEELVRMAGGETPETRNRYKSFTSSLLSRQKEEMERVVESKREQVKYGAETTYGDTSHPHPAVIYGVNKTVDEILAALKEPGEERCSTASGTEYPCDLSAGHEGECHNDYARPTQTN